jgi:single-strand DNA-binding protein
MNVWNFTGRVGADAEMRTTQNGQKLVNFRVAVKRGFGDREKTDWVDCTYWGERAAKVGQYIKKGNLLVISGEVGLEEFQRRDGTPGAKLAVTVDKLDLDSKGKSEGAEGGGGYERSGGGYGGGTPNAGYGGSGGGATNKPKPKPMPEFDDDLDDTIPF